MKWSNAGIVPHWLRTYQRETFAHDALAGLIVTAMLVPQSLAYAMLAGLPPHIGLYASVLPLVAYAVFGTSMTLAVGPVAVSSLMTAAAIAPIATAGTEHYAAMAMALAGISGVMLFVAGWLRLGFLARLLSHPVTAGFMVGAAVLIIVGQLKSLLGVSASGHTTVELVISLVQAMPRTNFATAALGFGAIIALLLCRRMAKPALERLGVPPTGAAMIARLAPLAVVVLATAGVAIYSLDTRFGIAVVGTVPGGLPTLVLPELAALQSLLIPAALISLIGFVESVSVAQSLGAKRNERVDPDAELRGLGAANLASAFSGGFAVAGGFARSAVNFAAGARTPMAGIVAAALMGLVLVALSGLFAKLPLAVLAATVIVAVAGLVELSMFRYALRHDRADALGFALTGLVVLALGVEAGIACGVALSVGTLLWRTSRPHIAVVGRLPGTEHYRNVERFTVETQPGLIALRVDENLLFVNAAVLEERVQAELRKNPDTRNVLLILSSVSQIDTTAMHELLRLYEDLAAREIQMSLAEMKGPVQTRLAGSTLLEKLGNHVFVSAHEAFEALGARRDAA